MERGRVLSSKLLFAAVMLSCTSPVSAAIGEAARALYTARLADNAASRFSGLSASPLTGVAGVPILDTIVVWDRLRRDSYDGQFSEYAAFLKANPDWPQAITIRRQAEKRIDNSVSAQDRLNYFKAFPPLSAIAKLRLAEAQAQRGKREDAAATARDAWDSAGLDQVAEGQLLAQFEKDLTPADDLSRADRLLWTGQVSAAARMLPRITMDRRLWLLARIALRSNSPDVQARMNGVPAALRNDPGLLLDQALWMKRNGDLVGARTLLANARVMQGSVYDPETWLKNRLEMARTAWRAGDFDAAHRLLDNHNSFPLGRPLSERSLAERLVYVDTEWLAGWLALRKQGRPAEAVAHFQNVRSASLTPLSQSRGDYWTGRALEAAGRKADATAAYAAAASHVDYFYGQLAAERLGRPLALVRPPLPVVGASAAADFRASPLVRAATALGELEDHDRQTYFLRALVDHGTSNADQLLVAGLAKPLDRLDAGVLAGKAARSDGELALIDMAFPVLELPAAISPQFTFIHAISRQESQFDRAIISSANARGLMQLLPRTAAEVAARLGLEASTARLTTDPIYNVTLGGAYFFRMRDNFGGSNVLAVASYNAGPGNVRKFITLLGDPRAPGVDMVDWIESIPFSETRNYVQRVLENAVVYDLLHPQTSVMPVTNRLSAYLGKADPG